MARSSRGPHGLCSLRRTRRAATSLVTASESSESPAPFETMSFPCRARDTLTWGWFRHHRARLAGGWLPGKCRAAAKMGRESTRPVSRSGRTWAWGAVCMRGIARGRGGVGGAGTPLSRGCQEPALHLQTGRKHKPFWSPPPPRPRYGLGAHPATSQRRVRVELT